MALVLNTNIASMNPLHSPAAASTAAANPAAIQEEQQQQATTLQGVSTDLSINSKKDDANRIHPTQSQSQTKDLRSLNMAVRNASDGISMAKTADGALDEIAQNLQHVNALAIESANVNTTDAEREAPQQAVNKLTQDINRIVDTTEFNGKKLLNEEAFSSVLQVGVKGDSSTRVATGLEGGLKAQPAIDKVTFSGAGENFSVSEADRAAGFTESKTVGDAFLTKIGFDKDSGLPTDALKKGLANQLKDLQGNSANLAAGLAKIGTTEPPGIKFTVNGVNFAMQLDGTPTAIKSLSAIYDSTQINLGNSANPPANTDAINLATDFRSANAYEEGFTPEKLLVSYQAEKTNAATSGNTVAIENSNALFNILNKDSSASPSVDISTQASAQSAISASASAIEVVSETRATFGEAIKRFEAAIASNSFSGNFEKVSGVNANSESLPATRSSIQDAKVAVETADRAKQQVLQQAGVTSLSQGNASAQSVLGLLA